MIRLVSQDLKVGSWCICVLSGLACMSEWLWRRWIHQGKLALPLNPNQDKLGILQVVQKHGNLYLTPSGCWTPKQRPKWVWTTSLVLKTPSPIFRTVPGCHHLHLLQNINYMLSTQKEVRTDMLHTDSKVFFAIVICLWQSTVNN